MSREAKKLLENGNNYKEFKLLNCVEIVELQSTLMEFEHTPTGAQIMHLANEDIENVFCLSLRTLPNNSNGVAHILEHTVLCGSEKYPIKDPFFSMNRRSLHTYMNALTGSDFTCYPAASQVPKDFYNLLEVYLDAVFNPQLKELSFLQEGHRLEFATHDDPSTPLKFKGIVFNEMKGSMSNPESRLWYGLMRNLFPDTPYGFVSGGDPRFIPSLTYQELLEFHKTYYHPGRCLFYFYGNMPIESHLDFLQEHALKDIGKVPPLPPIARQTHFRKPIQAKIYYPIAKTEQLEDKSIACLGWLTCHVKEQQEALSLQILDFILMGTDAAPLKSVLLRSGLCKQADSYIDTDVNELPFVIVCKGCRSENVPLINSLILETLKSISENEIPPHLIEGAMHQLELSRSEIGGGHAPFGLSLFMRAGLLKQHGVRAEDSLKIHTLFETLRSCTEDPFYLQTIIKRYLLNNPHRVDLLIEADQDLSHKEELEEQVLLNRIRESLTEKQEQEIIDKAKELYNFQENHGEENIEILPKVTLDDVSRKARDFPLLHESIDGLEVFHHDCFTNHLVYADLLFELPNIPERQLPLLRLLTNLLPEVGSGGRDYKANLEYMQQHTGGIGCSLFLHLQAQDFNQYKPALGFRGKALHRKIDKLFLLLKDMISSADLTDVDRIRELVMQYHNSLENGLNHNALKYASSLSAGGLSIPSRISNYWYGLDYLFAIREITKELDTNPNTIIEELRSLQNQLLCLKNAHLVLSCDQDAYELLKGEAFFGLGQVSQKSFQKWKGDVLISNSFSHGRTISTPVAFTSTTIESLPYVHADAPALNILSHLFENKTLHKRVREQGGAYGAGASNNPLFGQFSFYSYRDPHIASTLKAFHEAVTRIANGHFDKRDLEEAKLGIIQGIDSPVPPGGRAMLAYSWLCSGRTHAVREVSRQRLLDFQTNEIQRVARDYLLPKMKEAITVTLASEQLIESENKVLESMGYSPLPIYPI